jgi:hypothetical protein
LKQIKYITIISLFALPGMLGWNGTDPIPPTEEAQNALIEALQGTWAATEVRKENTVISDFENFSLTITDKSYSTANGAPVWPSSGSFDFTTAETEDEFLRQDGRLFTASESNGRVTITIIYNEETARGEYGTYEFVLE